MGKFNDLLNNEIVKKGLNKTLEVVKTGVSIAAPFMITAALNGTTNRVQDKVRFCGDVGYGDAVRAILESGMYSSSMEEALALLQKGKDQEYYKSIIRVVESGTYSSTKMEMIKTINSKDEE